MKILGTHFGATAGMLITTFLIGCVDTGETGLWGDPSGAEVTRGETASDLAGVGPGALQRGTDDFLGEGAASEESGTAIVVPAGGDTVQLSLVDASIEAAAMAILSDTLGLNYVIGEGVQGRITIQTTGPVPKAVLLDLFEASLAANGAQLRKDGEIINIVAGTSGNSAFSIAGAGLINSSSIVVAPLKFIGATDMIRLLEPLSEQGLRVSGDRERNLLFLSGTTAQLEAALDALNLFDVNVLQGKSIALVQMTAADPEDVVVELKKIFASEEGGSLEGVIEFIPNPRLGSVLVISSRASYIDRAKRWIRELDQTATGSGEYMQVYELENRSASDVAPILNSLLASGGGDASNSDDASPDGTSSGNGGSQGASVVADDTKNALIVRASAEEQDQVVELLRSLDSLSRQVLLEATIAEVSLTDEMSIGTRWFFETGNWDVGFSDLSTGAVAGTNPGFTAVFGAGSANVAISALASVTDVSIVSAPTLMVLDNKEGVLQIGDQVPVASQSTTSNGGDTPTVVTQVDYRDTGIILKVKPRIGSGGRIILEITQEVSDVVVNRVSGIDSPTIQQRMVQTTVALDDGQTLALGGLVMQHGSSGRTEVPGLGQIPVLGNLFRNKHGSKDRTELLILIRPRVVESDLEAADTTNYWRGQLAAADSLLGAGIGSTQHNVTDFAE